MKTWTLILLFISFSSSLEARDRTCDPDLTERVRSLELTVSQLQDEIYRSRSSVRPYFSCMLTTPLGGTYSGQGPTLIEAKARTLNTCEKGNKGFCVEEKLVCEKAD